jgi:hypothetical protein
VVFDDPDAAQVPAASLCAIPIMDVPRACDADFAVDTTVLNGYRIRQFPLPGTYTYRDTVSGAVGQVEVKMQ